MCKREIELPSIDPCPFCDGKSKIIKTKEPLNVRINDREVKVFFTVMYAACKECGATGKHFYPAFLPEEEAREENVIKDVISSWIIPSIWRKANEHRHQSKA